jgi:hypothetical protein
MATTATANDRDWAIYDRIRRIAAWTGNPEIKRQADEFRAHLMGPPVTRDRYSPDERDHVAHDAAPVAASTHPIARPPLIVQDKYRAYANAATPHAAFDAQPAKPAASDTRSNIRCDAYARYRR